MNFFQEIGLDKKNSRFFCDRSSEPGANEECIYFGLKHHSAKPLLFFSWLAPLLIARNYLRLYFAKRRHGLTTIICIGDIEKFIFSPSAKRLGLRLIFFEFPRFSTDADELSLQRLYQRTGAYVKFVAFGSLIRQRLLESGVAESNIHLMIPRATHDQPRVQDSIFSSLAKLDHSDTKLKPFSLGTITDLSARNQLENLLRALCQAREFIPHMQLIVIGRADERKSYLWLTKKLAIFDLVWFVGEQEFLQKWIDGFDVYLELNSEPRVDDYLNLTKVLHSKIPVIGFQERGLEDYVVDQEGGFIIQPNEPEQVSEKLILLQQDSALRKKMGRQGALFVDRQSQMRDSKDIIKLIME